MPTTGPWYDDSTSAIRATSLRSPSKWLFTSITSGTRPATSTQRSPSDIIFSGVSLNTTRLSSAEVLPSSAPEPSVRRPSASSWCTIASPSAVSWMSHSMAKFAATAAAAAPGMFSMMPRARSCRPRWATGRAVNQSGARIRVLRLRDLENTLDLDRGIGGQGRDADRRPRMAALVAEGCNHQVGGAVQHFWAVEEIRRRVDEAAEPDHAHHLVEVAERGLDLGQQVDGAAARRGIALLHGNAGPELALGDQLA